MLGLGGLAGPLAALVLTYATACRRAGERECAGSDLTTVGAAGRVTS